MENIWVNFTRNKIKNIPAKAARAMIIDLDLRITKDHPVRN
jgi:hypothetical protein